MENDNFSVALSPLDATIDNRPGGARLRYLKVVSFDKTANSITVKYGGAYRGEYEWVVFSLQ